MAAFAAVYSPLPQEGDVAVRRRRIGRQVFRTYPQGYRPAPSRSGKQKEGPFMGRLWVNCARLGNPMQDCHLGKEPDITRFSSRLTVILSRRRRISVCVDSASFDSKCRSAGIRTLPQPYLAAPFWGRSLRYGIPAHHHSVTGVTKVRWLSLHFKIKFLREVVKMGCLCNINVWRRKSGSSMEGFYFLICHVYREYSGRNATLADRKP